MKLIEYTPEQAPLLRQTVGHKNPFSSLLHPPFVDYYYTTNRCCRLYLIMLEDGTVGAILGLERLRFEWNGRELELGFGSNFCSVRPGVGGVLFMHWLKSCQGGVVFGGSEETHRIIHQQKWTYYPGVKSYRLNRSYPSYHGEAKWRSVAKSAREWICLRLARYATRIPAIAAATTVHEEVHYDRTLLPSSSPFSFRFAPTLEYLAWRYNTGLSFVRYRLFRILQDGATRGYVVLNDQPHRLLIAQCDGDDPAVLSYGVLLSVLKASRDHGVPREVVLTCCHPVMRRIYERFGFVDSAEERPFALGSLRREVDLPATDTSNWHINIDVGDNGLRAPFLDQEPPCPTVP